MQNRSAITPELANDWLCPIYIEPIGWEGGKEGREKEENKEEADGSSIVSQREPIGPSLDPCTQEAFNSC